ncbi:uncharacterized protein LY89DRAFT_572539 [Mollisia scopiformis]|uniref:Thioredoxin-like fold domain-containing protein n=1 Tax=Mollisia scopiformis TaxID=149040 RepID=A0A194XUR0_MOLSC|nr:uncharacterized protein LY89DRAFT_572539 [Mollisia scopiformis]KUJ23774.1 hypothetical protein LY89DRAFT_572539 [Mollisia scopiformis]
MASTTYLAPSILLHRGWNESSYVWSPFVTKVEARMRFAGLSYKQTAGSPRTAPKGKIPYIELSQKGSDPELIGDSSQIIERLVNDGLLPDLNAKLGPVERAHDMALRALLEDKLYFYQGYEKWHENYYAMRDHSLSSIPYPIRIIVGLLAYRKTMTTLYGQGSGRFSGQEIAGFRENIWANIEALLVDSRKKSAGSKEDAKCFWVLGGDGPSEADAVLYGFIIGALICFAAPVSQRVVRTFPVIKEYAQRIHDRYFPDYTGWNESYHGD